MQGVCEQKFCDAIARKAMRRKAPERESPLTLTLTPPERAAFRQASLSLLLDYP
jgi:hypothetical protein